MFGVFKQTAGGHRRLELTLSELIEDKVTENAGLLSGNLTVPS